MHARTWERREGSASPLGATRLADGACNFALYARHATAVTLLLYDTDDGLLPAAQIRRDPVRHKSGRVWHCRMSPQELGAARYYAYRVAGPSAPGQRFDPDKVLLDPYARAVHFPPGYDRSACSRAGDTAGKAPLGLIDADLRFDWGPAPRPCHGADLVIYELHVKGFTARANSGVAAGRRGTFLGIVAKIPYLLDLGITAVELLPVHQYDPGESNYWGYMTLGFFAVHAAYGSDGLPRTALTEFRQMVRALHEAGIEVLLDVVYNHTSEGGIHGPTYSFRGIDPSTYYLLAPDDSLRDDTGTGNVLRTAHPAVRTLVTDSLRYWARAMHVDGFRFDLATIFTRQGDGTIDLDDPAILTDISSDPDLGDRRLIAEAWDMASYQLGRSFPATTWLQWNGRYRDDVRSFVKGDNGVLGAFVARLYGSDDLFPDTPAEAYHAYQSINFVTAHDGFTLHDLVAYNGKHNEANGHGNTDGSDDNRSWNCGWEGETGASPDVLALRQRQLRNFCCLLFLSNGTPMFCAGDEFAHTQLGNNNPYNQDNETTWLDWDRLASQRDLHAFFRRMIAFRKAHPSLSRSRYWRDDVRWYGVDGPPDFSATSHAIACGLAGAAEDDRDLYLLINAWWQPLRFAIQEGTAGEWHRVIDTAGEAPADFAAPGAEPLLTGMALTVQPRSIVLLMRR